MSEDKDENKQMIACDLYDRISISPEVYVRQVQPNSTYESIINQARAETQIDAFNKRTQYLSPSVPWELSEDPLEHLYQMTFRNRFERWLAKKLLKWKHGIEIQ